MTTFRAALFDMDGLLLDSERPVREAWMQVCAAAGAPIDEEAYAGVIGRNARDSRAHLLSICGPALDYPRAAAEVERVLEDRFGRTGYPLKPGVLELLTWLQARGVPMAVASSTGHREVARRLEQAGILPFFGAVAGGDQVSRGKPAPDLYLLASERLGRVRPEQCLAFEDSEPGAQAAIAANMRVVIVPDLRQPSGALVQRSAARIASLRDAIALCEGWLAGGVPFRPSPGDAGPR